MSASPESEVSKVAVIGARGNAGGLAAELILHHPELELSMLTTTDERLIGKRTGVGSGHPDVVPTAPLEGFDPDQVAERSDAAIVAYPHGESAPAVAELRERGVPVVDLSADNRLSAEAYARYYGGEAIPELLAEAVYGLTELNRDSLRDAELVANPGCYATAAILALAPLRERLAEVVVDGKSGISGAGRGADVVKDAKGYRPFAHPHLGELEQELPGADFRFVPHLIPEYQGLLVTCHVTLDRWLDQDEIDELYRGFYDGDSFVRVQAEPPGINEVRKTNRCHVSVHVDPETGNVVAFAAIDNLWKGAAGQAIQNLNVMTGRPETAGLEPYTGF